MVCLAGFWLGVLAVVALVVGVAGVAFFLLLLADLSAPRPL